MKITWHDADREPRCPSSPAYPDGIDVDLSKGAVANCSAALPYPARRCGAFHIECETCGVSVGVTTAGRRDDPRSVKLACKLETVAKQ